MIDTIVVGFDGSEPSERALALGCEIARKFGAKLMISHTPREETITFAAEAISGFYVGTTVVQKDVLMKAAQAVGAKASAIAAKHGVTDPEVHIGHGDPAHDVLERARLDDADLIVTGRRGLGDFRGLMLGSVSHLISRDASCPCLTVP
ncbi:universal stress protein [Sulfitobacter sp. S190]|uniref:universal stress protein n=1 Tax=Sulfitobacter sp. S190 TaxID=2867022 RepID=UPI0021A261D0|nr:universal stress protein [Sulfitobacter sp. S190]UWR23064.1 universal stress protein [Sulfitobacter sp. S190]